MATTNQVHNTTATTAISPEFPGLIGDMYARWALDCVIELAYAVSNDFINRPHLYQHNEVPNEIVDLRMSYGMHREFPNTQQRLLMQMPIFGRSDGLRPDGNSSGFHMTRRKLIEASIAYAERVYDTGLEMLKERIRSSWIPLNDHLISVAGRSLEASYGQSQVIFDVAANILKSPVVAQVFGVERAQAAWPLGIDDPNGAKLVEAIGVTLKLSPDYALTHAKFILLQRVAREGREALALVLAPDTLNDTKPNSQKPSDPPPQSNLEKLITKVYSWGTSIRDYHSAS